jgi:tRNA pseudouridine38-40 synthase
LDKGRVNVRNLKLVLEYDGTDFCGWQKQPKVRTVEGELVRVLADLLGPEPEIIAAGRTDSGVHAMGQVANFSWISEMSPRQIRCALNALLPVDIRVLEAEEVPLAFNARFDAKKRTYRYEISTQPTSIWRRYKWYVKYDMDIDAMRDAAGMMVGDGDFSAFTSKDETRSPWISMKEAGVAPSDSRGVSIVLTANRFLRKMVRMITGTLVEIGRGSMKPSELRDILASRERARAGPCAPPHGLYLVRVEY